MAKNGLDKWFANKWVDIEVKKRWFICKMWKKNRRKMQNVNIQNACLLAKARRMTEGQRRSAVKRKRAVAQGVGGKPTNVKTFAKEQKLWVVVLWQEECRGKR